jgi:hypothetical protein
MKVELKAITAVPIQIPLALPLQQDSLKTDADSLPPAGFETLV